MTTLISRLKTTSRIGLASTLLTVAATSVAVAQSAPTCSDVTDMVAANEAFYNCNNPQTITEVIMCISVEPALNACCSSPSFTGAESQCLCDVIDALNPELQAAFDEYKPALFYSCGPV